jgi:hypothetical protein
MMGLGLARMTQVDLGARWRIILVSFAFVEGILHGWDEGHGGSTSVWIYSSFIYSILFGSASFLLSIALEWSILRIAPYKLVSFARLFHRPLVFEGCGLAVLRGTLVGLALLGADTLLVWAGTSHLGMWLDSSKHIALQADLCLSRPLLSTLGFLLFLALATAGLLATLTSLVARIVRRSWLAWVLAAVLSAAGLAGPAVLIGTVQPYYWKLSLVFLGCLFLVWAFRRFDLLTVFWSSFTFVFCWSCYGLLIMLAPAGNFEEWLAFAVFGLIVLAATAVAFKSSVRTGWRRLAAAFE